MICGNANTEHCTMAGKPMARVIESNDRLTASLLPHLPQGNLVMSTFSLGTVLGMVLAGSKENTKKQLLGVFGTDKDEEVEDGFQQVLQVVKGFKESPDVKLHLANKLYSEEKFKVLPAYTKILKSSFGTSPESKSFVEHPGASQKAINEWVEEQTNKKIKDLLPDGSVNSNTRVVLVNAIYFKGDWKNKFDPKLTKELDFNVDKDTKVKVPMMFQEAKYSLLEDIKELDGASALRMPYKGESLDMVFILPKENSNLAKLEKKLSDVKLSKVFDDFGHESKVKAFIPKFKVESSLELNEPLNAVGIKDMFDQSSADLSGISGANNLFVSVVVQKAFIEVNEEGAEAAAATGAVVMFRSLPPPTPVFKCDRPFYYMIRERSSGLVLFSGRIVNPKD